MSRFAKMSLNPMRGLGQLGFIYSWFVIIFGTTSSHVFAQIVPDTTLPNNSIVTPNGTTFTIEGGTRAGGNLFHSFQDFSIPTNTEAFFNNAAAINNLITRVTGGQISNIDGLIRANGGANLFLLNPNGIIFGPNARLNIGGSFFASSASSLQFADGFEFSATNPQPTPLLTINVPIGLQLGANPGNLVIRSQQLQVLPGQTMGLMGGNLLLEGAQVQSSAGRIELWSAVNSGLSIISNNGHLAIDSARTTQSGDIQLTQQAVLDASGVGGGTIQIQGRRVSIGEGSQVLTITQGSQPGGNLTVRGTESVEVSGANPSRFTVLSSDTRGAGAGGNLTIETGRFLLQGAALLSANTFGQGAGGNLTVRASEGAVLVGTGFNSLQQFLGGVLSGQVKPSDRIGGLFAVTAGDGSGGHVSIDTGFLVLQNGAIAFAPVFGRGNGGNLHIRANSVDAVGSGLIVGTSFGSQGNAGNLTITGNQVTIQDGSILSGATFGSGHGGHIAIDASDFVDLSRTLPNALIPTGIANNSFGTGKGGNVRITTGRLTVREGAIIGANSGGAIATGVIPFGGPGGDILLEARESIEFTGGAANNFAGRVGGVLTSGPGTTTFTAFPAGHLTIRTPRLTVADGAQISSASLSSGNGGHLTIEASDRVEVIGRSSLTGLPSAIVSSSGRADVTNLSGMGDGGNLTIQTRSLIVRDGAAVSTSSTGSGRAGNLTVRAADVDVVDGPNATASSTVAATSRGVGDSGDILIQSDRVRVGGGADISATAFGQGRSGNLTVRASESIELFGARINPNNPRDFSRSGLFAATEGIQDGGSISIITPRFLVRDGARVSVSTRGPGTATARGGRGGNLTVIASESVQLRGSSVDGRFPSGLFALSGEERPNIRANEATGDGGNLSIETGQLTVAEGAEVSVSARGPGAAGNLQIRAETVALNNRGIITTTTASGQGGNMILQVGSLQLRDRSQTAAEAGGSGNGGNIAIASDTLVLQQGSRINANAFQGTGGRIAITTQGIFVSPNSAITASSQFGVAGVVTVNTPNVNSSAALVELPNQLEDPSDRILVGCAAAEGNSFTVIGRGGLPEDPTTVIRGATIWRDLQDYGVNEGINQPDGTLSDRTTSVLPPQQQSTNPPNQIVEATGWIINSSGQIELVAVLPNTSVRSSFGLLECGEIQH